MPARAKLRPRQRNARNILSKGGQNASACIRYAFGYSIRSWTFHLLV